jgi:hypothetical protein
VTTAHARVAGPIQDASRHPSTPAARGPSPAAGSGPRAGQAPRHGVTPVREAPPCGAPPTGQVTPSGQDPSPTPTVADTRQPGTPPPPLVCTHPRKNTTVGARNGGHPDPTGARRPREEQRGTPGKPSPVTRAVSTKAHPAAPVRVGHLWWPWRVGFRAARGGAGVCVRGSARPPAPPVRAVPAFSSPAQGEPPSRARPLSCHPGAGDPLPLLRPRVTRRT